MSDKTVWQKKYIELQVVPPAEKRTRQGAVDGVEGVVSKHGQGAARPAPSVGQEPAQHSTAQHSTAQHDMLAWW